MNDLEKLMEAGKLETVGDIIGEPQPAPVKPAVEPFVPATLDGVAPPPAPGIYFGMDEEEYHAIPALSSHGIKKMAASPMIFYAGTAWLSERKRRKVDERRDETKVHQTIGKAYHCRIMEGAAEFNRRFVVELSEDDHPDALKTTDQIKAAIAGLGAKPSSKVPDTMPDGTEYMRAAKKDDWIAQLLALNPDAEVFDVIKARFLEEHDGKAVINFDDWEQIEIAAKMIEADPELRHAFSGGHAEVTLIWVCGATGVLMKARADYLKIKAMVDLKTVANQRENSLERAARFEIAGYKYTIQPALYTEGAKAVRELVRKHGDKVIHVAEGYHHPAAETRAWAKKWASHRGDDEWLWVFQQKGDAPIARGIFYPLAGTTNMIVKDVIMAMKRKFRTFSETFGTSPWVDVAPIYTIADEDLPPSAVDF